MRAEAAIRLAPRLWKAMPALAVALAAAGVAGAQGNATLRPEAGRVAAAPPALQARLREDPLVYFRFLNRAWAGAVCETFRGELQSLPTAILHGDAHLEQYALTAAGYGLDDFDDAAHGPSVIDLVRFLGSTAQSVVDTGVTRWSETFYVSPGVRWAYNFASGLQLVPGIAVPIGVGPSHGDVRLVLYLSAEHSFRRGREQPVRPQDF